VQIGKCKYNIVRNGDIKHLCDDNCFKRFRANPSLFLKGKAAQAASSDKSASPKTPSVGGAAPPSTAYKTCVVCQLMNINTQVSKLCKEMNVEMRLQRVGIIKERVKAFEKSRK
jgi:hypothetical protein